MIAMRALLPERAADVDVHAWYAQDWLDVGGLRVNFIASVDGSVSAGGVSRGLQTPGDNRVFAALRDLADVVVAGSGTVLAEGYAVVSLSQTKQQRRRELGLAETLTTAVVSRSLLLDPKAPLFHGAESDPRTIVLTCVAADPQRRAALEAVADVIICGEDKVEPTLVRAALAERGLIHVLCEGGPTLFAEFVRAEVVDELCLTVSPLLVGPGPSRIVAGQPWDVGLVWMRLVGLLEEDGAFFCRYRIGSDEAGR
jgi:riboflavin biosynthesis pyrimidine reductase